MPAHPLRGKPEFEAIKKAISAQLGAIYIAPASILTKPFPVIEYDDNGKVTFQGEKQEQIVEGVEAMAGGSKATLDNAKFKVLPGTLNTPSGGPVSGTMPKGTGWIDI